MNDWKRVDKYAMERGNQTICKKFLDGCTLYCLYIGDTNVGHWEDKEEAFKRADELRNALAQGRVD